MTGDVRYWKLHFVRTPDERIHVLNSPMMFPCKSQSLDSSLVECRSLLSGKLDLGNIGYTAIIKIVLGNIHHSGLALDVGDGGGRGG